MDADEPAAGERLALHTAAGLTPGTGLRRRCLLSLAAALLPIRAGAQPASLTVFAAASLTDAVADIDRLWQAAGHAKLRTSFASSSTLARQIEQGAPADVFASADEQWADALEEQGLLAPNTRTALLTNTLVLVVPKTSALGLTLDSGLDLAALLGPNGRLAVGDPAHVPAGIYAKQALTKLGLWSAAEPRLARSASVRSALLLVERGEAPAGIVYATDVAASPTLAVAGTFPPGLHDPITYPFALVKGHDSAEARAFLDFLASPEATKAFKARGFGVR